MIYWPAKAPGDVEEFPFDFSQVLQTGESIVSHDLTAAGVTLDSDTSAASKVTVLLSGGQLGTPGIVTCSVTTDAVPAQTYSLTGILPIGEEPVSLDMAKAQVRYDDSVGEEDLLGELVQSAREYVEKYTSSRLVPAALEMTFAAFAKLDRLSEAPVQSVVDVKYLDSSGVEQVLDPSVYEFLNVSADPLRPRLRAAYGQTFPPTRSADDAVRVSAIVGYSVVPKPVIRAMLLLIGQWYDYRTGVQVDARGVPAEIPNAVTSLLANYRA